MALQDLLTQLVRAREENRLKEKIALLTKPKLLILDEIRYLALDAFRRQCLFQLVSKRYERLNDSDLEQEPWRWGNDLRR